MRWCVRLPESIVGTHSPIAGAVAGSDVVVTADVGLHGDLSVPPEEPP